MGTLPMENVFCVDPILQKIPRKFAALLWNVFQAFAAQWGKFSWDYHPENFAWWVGRCSASRKRRGKRCRCLPRRARLAYFVRY